MAKISWTDHVRNEEVLHTVKKEMNITHTIQYTIKIRHENWTEHILCTKCLLKQVIEGKTEARIEVARRRGQHHKQLLDGFKDTRGHWN